MGAAVSIFTVLYIILEFWRCASKLRFLGLFIVHYYVHGAVCRCSSIKKDHCLFPKFELFKCFARNQLYSKGCESNGTCLVLVLNLRENVKYLGT